MSAALATFCSDQFLFTKMTQGFYTSGLVAFLCDLQIVFVLVFLVIVPLCNPAGNLWNLIGKATNSDLNQDSVSQTPILLLSVCHD